MRGAIPIFLGGYNDIMMARVYYSPTLETLGTHTMRSLLLSMRAYSVHILYTYIYVYSHKDNIP